MKMRMQQDVNTLNHSQAHFLTVASTMFVCFIPYLHIFHCAMEKIMNNKVFQSKYQQEDCHIKSLNDCRHRLMDAKNCKRKTFSEGNILAIHSRGGTPQTALLRETRAASFPALRKPGRQELPLV